MFSDFHVHTYFSEDSNADIKNVIENAAKMGMKHICTTDHNDYDMPETCGTFLLDTAEYFKEIYIYKEIYKDIIDVRTGIECGLQTHVVTENTALIESNPFDFVIGSIHVVNGTDPYYPEFFGTRSDTDGFREYFETMLKNVRYADCYDVLGHMDYIVRYAPLKDKNYSYRIFSEIIDEILKVIIAKGKGIELNTGGLAAGLPFPNPCADIVKRYKELGGEIITVGSDAHTAADVGRFFDSLPDFLKSCGFNHYTVFKERKPEFIRL